MFRQPPGLQWDRFWGGSAERVVETASASSCWQNSVKLLAWWWNSTLFWLVWLGDSPPSLEHLYMEYDEDDDIFFAKWMSSFWGHNLIDEGQEGRGHKKRQPRLCSERRASLPVRAVCSFLCVCTCCTDKCNNFHPQRHGPRDA